MEKERGIRTLLTQRDIAFKKFHLYMSTFSPTLDTHQKIDKAM